MCPHEYAGFPTELGLGQALYILRCLKDGMNEDQIIVRFDGDTQLVRNWINFLEERNWILKQDSVWQVTRNGLDELHHYYDPDSQEN